MPTEPKSIRAFRLASDKTLDELADMIGAITGKRPSAANLSRIERGMQPVPVDMLVALRRITGIPGKVLRPDLTRALGGDAA